MRNILNTFLWSTNRKMDKNPNDGKLQRRASLSDQISLRDIMRELQKMQETQSMYQKISQEQLLDFKNDMQQELGTMKREIQNIQQEIKELRQEKSELRTELKTNLEQTDLKVESIKAKNQQLEQRQDRLEIKELEFQLRFQNVVEEKNEDKRQIISELSAQILECTQQEAVESLDRIYRINARYAKRFNTPRDIIVRFAKMSTRDEILRRKNGKPVMYKERSIVILKELPYTVLQKQRDLWEQEERAKQLKYIKQYHFCNANKPGKWLKRKLRKKKEKSYINTIKTKEATFTREEDILNQFRLFFNNLYKQENIEEDKIIKFLDQQKLTRTTGDQKRNLNKEITDCEIKNAIHNLDPQKVPGPDGLTAAYYKTFEEILTPPI
nr:PREDICTED: probable DNA double-strand break repair Rad50 ATPase [Anolis carolinensis]|eukprot:XP_016847036.1 PREDICTED: probable DNA double-strand break repair Rad50 ATPase [Anolis carolinensis]